LNDNFEVLIKGGKTMSVARPGEDENAVRSSTPLQNLSAALTRSEAVFKMFRDFSVCGLRELVGASLQGLTDSSSLTAMDLYDRPLEEVGELLREREIKYTTSEARKACSPENFSNMAWTIDGERGVTLLIYGDRVVGIQRGIHQS
jgi:hypothetical protein